MIRDWVRAGAVAAVFAAILAASPAMAQGEGYVFDPVLSLRGDCVTSNALDVVADPGCPAVHAPQAFNMPKGAAVDSLGYLYVLSGGGASGANGRLDIFDPSGEFVVEVSFAELIEAVGGSLAEGDTRFADPAVDSQGNLYLHLGPRSAPVTPPHSDDAILYRPSSYPPQANTDYDSAETIDADANALAIDPDDDHLYVYRTVPDNAIAEYDSAENGSGLLRTDIASVPGNSVMTIEVGPNDDLLVSGLTPTAEEPFTSQVYVFDKATGAERVAIDGSDIPTSCVGGDCGFRARRLAIAADHASGDVFVQDTVDPAPVYRFRLDGGSGQYEYVEPLVESPFFQVASGAADLAVSNGVSSTNHGYVFLISHPTGVGHLFAFKPKPEVGPPVVLGQAFSGVSTREALLEADLDPNGVETSYRFEYVEEEVYLADLGASGPGHGFDHALQTPTAIFGSPSEPGLASAALTGLDPDTVYRFRLVAENCDATEPGRECLGQGEDSRFSTYPEEAVPSSCPNQGFRTGLAALLPDCRAYELVTPANTDGHSPSGGLHLSNAFDVVLASSDGDSVVFKTTGGSLPGTGGTGALDGDGYRARRTAAGWQSGITSPSGSQSQAPAPGGVSSDHDYWFWRTSTELDKGSLAIAPFAGYLRGPDGSFELIGQGSLDVDPHALGRWISPGATHVIFTSGGLEFPAIELEEEAPSSGTAAIYDRSPGGPTHVVSLLPGDETPSAPAVYEGVSADGRVAAFKLTEEGVTRLYLRIDNTETVEVTSGSVIFGGLSEDGSRLYYLKNGNIFAFDTAGARNTIAVGAGGESTLVNVSADGSHAYFSSPQQLDGVEGEAGKDNLYVWDGDSIQFIATLAHLDVIGETGASGDQRGGLGLWVSHVLSPAKNQYAGRASDPSRTSPDGRFLVFESHANLTGYDPDGHSEIYRYDAVSGALLCLSCNPTLAPPDGDAKLTLLGSEDEFSPLGATSHMANVTSDGRMAFFSSPDALVPRDANGVNDVYEWEANGVGGCVRADGCLRLISSGHSPTASYLYATTPSGSDVFFTTSDLLVRADHDGTPSIYDARIEGGFAETQIDACGGDACRTPASSPPGITTAASVNFSGPGNKTGPRRCAKGKRLVRRRGTARCVKKHRKPRRSQRRAGQ